MSENILMTFQLLGYGLGGVFLTLGLFIVLIALLVKIFPFKEKNSGKAKN